MRTLQDEIFQLPLITNIITRTRWIQFVFDALIHFFACFSHLMSYCYGIIWIRFHKIIEGIVVAENVVFGKFYGEISDGIGQVSGHIDLEKKKNNSHSSIFLNLNWKY